MDPLIPDPTPISIAEAAGVCVLVIGTGLAFFILPGVALAVLS